MDHFYIAPIVTEPNPSVSSMIPFELLKEIKEEGYTTFESSAGTYIKMDSSLLSSVRDIFVDWAVRYNVVIWQLVAKPENCEE